MRIKSPGPKDRPKESAPPTIQLGDRVSFLDSNRKRVEAVVVGFARDGNRAIVRWREIRPRKLSAKLIKELSKIDSRIAALNALMEAGKLSMAGRNDLWHLQETAQRMRKLGHEATSHLEAYPLSRLERRERKDSQKAVVSKTERRRQRQKQLVVNVLKETNNPKRALRKLRRRRFWGKRKLRLTKP